MSRVLWLADVLRTAGVTVVAIRTGPHGGYTPAVIAADYPINRNSVDNIVHRRTWRHIE